MRSSRNWSSSSHLDPSLSSLKDFQHYEAVLCCQAATTLGQHVLHVTYRKQNKTCYCRRISIASKLSVGMQITTNIYTVCTKYTLKNTHKTIHNIHNACRCSWEHLQCYPTAQSCPGLALQLWPWWQQLSASQWSSAARPTSSMRRCSWTASLQMSLETLRCWRRSSADQTSLLSRTGRSSPGLVSMAWPCLNKCMHMYLHVCICIHVIYYLYMYVYVYIYI